MLLSRSSAERLSSASKKLEPVVLNDGPSTTNPKEPSNSDICLSCANLCEKVHRCESCKSGMYCSQTCVENHASDHKVLCSYIQYLEKLEKQKRAFSVRESSQVNVTVKNTLVKLVGEKPIIKCQLKDVDCEALWDTGSMVSLMGLDWFNENFPDEEILSVQDFLEGDNLHLCAANNTIVEVEGVAILNLNIGNLDLTFQLFYPTTNLNHLISLVCDHGIMVPYDRFSSLKHDL